MADSIYAASLPAGYDAYLGYTDGRWPDFAAEVKRFPRAHVIGLAVRAGDPGHGCDCENYDLTPGQVPGDVHGRIRAGVWRPVVYASISAMPTVIGKLTAARIPRRAVRLLSAHYGHGRHICGPAIGCGPQMDGTQWTDVMPGLNGAVIDESLLAPGFFARPAARPALLEDEPMIMPAAMPKMPMALPNGTARVRLFASEGAKLTVDVRDGKASRDVELTYGSARTVPIPPGIHAIVVHRAAGDPGHDVSVVASA